MRTPKNRYIRILPLLALCLFFLSGCASARRKTPVTELSQLNDASRTIGVAADTTEGELVEEMFPQAKIQYFSDDVSAYLSVQQGKLDAFVYDKFLMEVAVRGGVTGVKLLEDTLGYGNSAAVAISPKTKIPDLEEKLNRFLNEINANHVMGDIAFRWLEERSEVMPNIPLPEESDLHLIVGTTGTSTPFSFYEGPHLVGYDIELAMRFAAWLGATIEFKTYDYSGLVPAALSGDVDCIFANLFVTPEREEALRFSRQTYAGPVGVMIRDPEAPIPEFTEFVDLSGKTVSMLTGAPFEELVKSKAPDVAQFTFFNNNPDMILALQSGKTDAILQNNAIATLAGNRNEGLCLFPQALDTSEFGIAFANTDTRVPDWQRACDSISEETKQAVWEKWTGADETAKVLPAQDWPGKNGVIQAAVCDSLEPMSYLDGKGNALGFDIEMILLMAKELDVHVQFTGMEFAAVLPYVQSGKADIGAGSIIITPEREEAVDFVSYYPASFVLIVRTADDTASEGGLLTSLREGFEKTFIREDRYLQFLEGIGMTLLITLLSALFGTGFGFLLFLACRRGNKYAIFLTGIFEKLMSGMPMIVLLMILYYVIFGRIAVSGALVSVLAFTMVFGAEIFSLMTTAVGAVDAGQTEAALALGYPDRKAFFKHILPQALPFFMPGYRSGLVNLIKSTSIVGYIAVQDLTKMGDLVRSRTYEAFFPLIATAVIYFVLAWLLVLAVDAVTKRVDPARRKTEDILKGVRTSAPSGD